MFPRAPIRWGAKVVAKGPITTNHGKLVALEYLTGSLEDHPARNDGVSRTPDIAHPKNKVVRLVSRKKASSGRRGRRISQE